MFYIIVHSYMSIFFYKELIAIMYFFSSGDIKEARLVNLACR